MNKLFYYGLTKENYKKCKNTNDAYMIKTNKVLSCVAAVAMFVLFIASIFLEQLSKFKFIYLSFFVVFALFTIAALAIGDKKYKHPIIGMYIICTILYGFGLSLALQYPDKKSTIIQLQFVLLPLLFTDKPFRVSLYILGILGTYLTCVFLLQDKSIMFEEAFNAISLSCLSIITHFIISNRRLKGFFNKEKYVETIKELIETQDEIFLIYHTDPLTGLYNRGQLFDNLKKVSNDSIKSPKAIVMIDIDHFKQINDTYGHLKGDLALSEFSKELKKLKYNGEITFYRYGGDEFIALIYEYKDEKFTKLSEDIHDAAKKVIINPDYKMTVSIGVAYINRDDDKNVDVEKWVANADEAVYEAKKAGRNQTFYK